MTYSIVFESKTGNTRQAAEAVRAALGEACCVAFGGPCAQAAQADVIFVGFWTDKGACPEALAQFLGGLTGKAVALFGTAGFGGDPAYFDGILQRVAALLPAGCKLLGGQMCQGRMPASVGARYEALVRQDPANAQTKLLLENFQRAQSHPDGDDLAGMEAFARRIWDAAQT